MVEWVYSISRCSWFELELQKWQERYQGYNNDDQKQKKGQLWDAKEQNMNYNYTSETYNRLSITGLFKSCFNDSSKRGMLSLRRYASWVSWYFLYAMGVSLPDLNPARRSAWIYWSKRWAESVLSRKMGSIENSALTLSISSNGVYSSWLISSRISQGENGGDGFWNKLCFMPNCGDVRPFTTQMICHTVSNWNQHDEAPPGWNSKLLYSITWTGMIQRWALLCRWPCQWQPSRVNLTFKFCYKFRKLTPAHSWLTMDLEQRLNNVKMNQARRVNRSDVIDEFSHPLPNFSYNYWGRAQ